MTAASYVNVNGEAAGQVDLPPEIFDVEPNVPVMHAAVKAHLAAIRSGTASTKTRAEVRGGGKKPWRQKGTGRARHGSSREPQWVGGGVSHGPKPRGYEIRLTKKTRALALKCALSDRAREGAIVVVDLPAFDIPKTKRANELLDTWGASGKVLLVTGRGSGVDQIDAWKSFRNLPHVLMVQVATTYRVLEADVVVLTREALEEITRAEPSIETGAPPEAGVAIDAQIATEDTAEAEEILAQHGAVAVEPVITPVDAPVDEEAE